MKILVPLDLGGNEILNVRLQSLATAPSPLTARIYWDTALTKIGIYDGAGWVYVGQAGAAPTYTLDDVADTATRLAMTTAERTKLSGVATAATANSADATLLARGNHTGTQAASTIIDLATVVKAYRLDEFAIPTVDVSLNSKKITNLLDPTAAQDAATKAYVDALSQGLDVKASVRVATTANITLSGTQTIDGVAVIATDRVLVKNQSTASQNGIYVVAAGAWTRATDADSSAKVTPGMFVFVEAGTAGGDSGWILTTDAPITLATTSLVFTQFSGAGQITSGAGMTKTGNTLDVGAGTGITVGADSVGVDTAVVVRKYAADIGGATSIAVVHNLGTKDVTWSLRQISDDVHVMCDAVSTSTTTLTLTFATAPTAASFRVVVHA